MRSPIIFRVFKNNQLVGVKQFEQDQIVIGHNADVQLDLDGEGVSPIHCMIELRDNGYYICDLGSQTGTFKNGQAILDEMIMTGDEIEIGPFKLSFFMGVPKPAVAPGQNVAPTPPTVPPPAPPPKRTVPEQMPPVVLVKKEEVKVAPVVPPVAPPVVEQPVVPTIVPPVASEETVVPAAAKPAIRADSKGSKTSFKKVKKSKTFAPPSEIQDLRQHLKPGKGPHLQVVVAWKERVLNTYVFKAGRTVKVGAGSDQVALPDGLVPKGFTLLDTRSGVKVNTTGEMKVEMVSAAGIQPVEDLARLGKSQRGGTGYSTRLDQGEMLCVTLPGGNLTLYIRHTAQVPVVPMLPPLMLSGSELTGVIMSVLMVGILALYVSATTPKDWEENKQEEVQRIAQVIFNKPPTPTPTPTPTPPPPPPPPPVAKTPPPPPPTPTPTPTPKKVVVADQVRDAQKKGPTPDKTAPSQVAARANEVAPKPNAQDRTKKFTSTRQGGAVKTGETAGANAQSANKDVSKIGLFSSLGGGGNRAKIDKAYSGTGDVIGMADQATGTAGFNENRGGDDLGSRFKDAGAGGKGTATQGIAGIGTKGRSSGQSAYGAADGFGSKSSVAIAGGGFEESFDATIDKEAIRRVIRAKLHEVKSCYERALNTLAKGQTLEGKIVLGWEIIEKGQARNVRVKSSNLGSPQVENCIRDRLASWVFPEPPAGMVAEVQAYPFVLNRQSN